MRQLNLTKLLADVNSKILEFETEKLKYAAEDIVNAVKVKQSQKTSMKVKEVLQVVKLPLFKDVANNYLTEQKGLGNYNIYTTNKSRLK